MDALLDRADVDGLMRRVDVGALLDRVDVNDLVGRIDMDGLIEDTDLGAVIARSSSGVASEALDAARSQAVGLDQFIDRWVHVCSGASIPVRSRRSQWPADAARQSHERPEARARRLVRLAGHYAGSVSRFLAFIIDAAVSAACSPSVLRPRRWWCRS